MTGTRSLRLGVLEWPLSSLLIEQECSQCHQSPQALLAADRLLCSHSDLQEVVESVQIVAPVTYHPHRLADSSKHSFQPWAGRKEVLNKDPQHLENLEVVRLPQSSRPSNNHRRLHHLMPRYKRGRGHFLSQIKVTLERSSNSSKDPRRLLV